MKQNPIITYSFNLGYFGSVISTAPLIQPAYGTALSVNQGDIDELLNSVSSGALWSIVKLTGIETQGELYTEHIKESIRMYRREITTCHEYVLKSNPQIKGELTLKLEIVDGVVDEMVFLSDSTGSGALVKCIEGKGKQWTFKPGCSEVVTISMSLDKKI